jgi:hypothetical protein
MTIIPDTGYRVSGSQIIDPAGQPISREDFLAKVASKEISLTANSLQMLGETFGPEMTRSLAGLAAPPPAEAVGNILGSGSTDDQAALNISDLMVLIAKTTQEQRKEMREVRDAEFDTQISKMAEQAKQDLHAARWEAAGMIVSGGLNMVGGYKGMQGARFEAGSAGAVRAKNVAETWGAGGKGLEGIGKWFAANDRDDASIAQRQAKAAEKSMADSKDVMDTLRETMAKVRETLQAIQNSDAEANRSIARM